MRITCTSKIVGPDRDNTVFHMEIKPGTALPLPHGSHMSFLAYPSRSFINHREVILRNSIHPRYELSPEGISSDNSYTSKPADHRRKERGINNDPVCVSLGRSAGEVQETSSPCSWR